ncbi:MAG: hypothetical protein ACK5QT_10900 [Oligoflexia bacterium]
MQRRSIVYVLTSLVSLVSLSGTQTAFAQSMRSELSQEFVSDYAGRPADYATFIKSGLIGAATQCGFELLDGRDQRLPSAVLSRDVEQVLARVKENGKVIPHVLFDTLVSQNRRDVTSFVWKKNGGQILEMSVNTDFNDIAVQAHLGGRVAFSRSSRGNHEVRTEWRVRAPNGGVKKVTEDEFRDYLKTRVVDFYGERICRDLYRPAN